MSVPSGLLAGLLLAFLLSVRGTASRDTPEVVAAVGQDVVLDLPGFEVSGDVDEIRWQRDGSLVALHRGGHTNPVRPGYEVLSKGGLRIRGLHPSHGTHYHAQVYNSRGAQVFQGGVHLRVLESVSKPEVTWECSNATLTCKSQNGTDTQLKLCQKQKCSSMNTHTQQLIRLVWATLDAPFTCTAWNAVSQEATEATVHCPSPDTALYISPVVGACGGGLALAICLGLLVVRVRKRRKQQSQRKDEELEMIAVGKTPLERGRGPRNVAASPPPPPPAPRGRAPGCRPTPPSHRAQHQQQKRPPPLGRQAPQQKAPPLPRPRGPPEPPHRAASSP